MPGARGSAGLRGRAEPGLRVRSLSARWCWALEAAGAEVHLAHPLGVRAFSYRRVKNDERDCTDLADLLRMGRLPEAWIAP
jgi:transposase